ncbi:MAG TPA: hypothetical protein VM144_02360 [Aestuariivirga sp.]|nr:hypothetical protein [Aestuariivirga sp.]
MDWNWYETAAVVALIISIATAWEVARLRKHMHLEDLLPTRKWTKAITGPRYVPKHQPDQVSEYADEDDRRFYRDFAPVADYLNLVYGDSPWSFENTGRLESKGFETDAEREIEIRYNQQKTGTIKLSCGQYGNERFGDIRADLNLLNGRTFGGYEVLGLAQTIGQIVTSTPDERRENKTNTALAMINSMWQVGEETTGNPEVELSFEGKASWYLSEYLPRHVSSPV